MENIIYGLASIIKDQHAESIESCFCLTNDTSTMEVKYIPLPPHHRFDNYASYIYDTIYGVPSKEEEVYASAGVFIAQTPNRFTQEELKQFWEAKKQLAIPLSIEGASISLIGKVPPPITGEHQSTDLHTILILKEHETSVIAQSYGGRITPNIARQILENFTNG